MADNVMTLVGNVTRDPELRYTPGGQAICKLSVVQSTRRQDKQTKEWVDGDPSFFDVTCWGALGENVAASLLKGQRVIVTGRMQQRKWQDKNTGENRYGWELVADDVAPSLRWAQAKVDMTTRTTAAERGEDPDGYTGGEF